MASSPPTLDLDKFTVPSGLRHRTQRGEGPPKTDDYGIYLTVDPHRWGKWVVKLEFKKLGEARQGNGFYVNIPNKAFDVILTAGHNLVDAPKQYCTDIRIVTATGKTPVSPDMIHVCQRYSDDPSELNAIYDYGVILLRRSSPTQQGFGFGCSLMLGLAQDEDMLQDRLLYVSGYRPWEFPPAQPRKSEGNCVSSGEDQLQYKAKTEEGMSGGPVWLGFRGVETVVAIHNYGADDDSQGNKGSRLNLDVWRTVCKWVNTGWTSSSLNYLGSSTFSMHLHILRSTSHSSGNKVTGLGRVRVGLPGRVETRFDVLPVSAAPGDRDWEACYGFLLCAAPSSARNTGLVADMPLPEWLRWEVATRKISLTNQLVAECEVKLLHAVAQPGKPFDIQARLDAGSWAHVLMDMKSLLDEEPDLESLLANDPQDCEDTTEISFMPVGTSKQNKKFEFK
ncbi:hypothetical protein GQ53DRAFT_827448 [Thozetella sp. PMI_491]|nr:hypothetical protein GQ53DRAFT_827448 [Thozetella sp. PMI_491]